MTEKGRTTTGPDRRVGDATDVGWTRFDGRLERTEREAERDRRAMS